MRILYLEGCEAHVQNPLDLEVLNIYNGEWYTLCAEGYTDQVGQVVCEELDHGQLNQSLIHDQITTDYPISPVSYSCIGNENSICSCETTPISCTNDQIVSIECTPPGKLYSSVYSIHSLLCRNFSILVSYTAKITFKVILIFTYIFI